jgi:hypothetical protein
MNHLKEAVKLDGTTHFLTYADNYAIGYFRKQVRKGARAINQSNRGIGGWGSRKGERLELTAKHVAQIDAHDNSSDGGGKPQRTEPTCAPVRNACLALPSAATARFAALCGESLTEVPCRTRVTPSPPLPLLRVAILSLTLSLPLAGLLEAGVNAPGAVGGLHQGL